MWKCIVHVAQRFHQLCPVVVALVAVVGQHLCQCNIQALAGTVGLMSVWPCVESLNAKHSVQFRDNFATQFKLAFIKKILTDFC